MPQGGELIHELDTFQRCPQIRLVFNQSEPQEAVQSVLGARRCDAGGRPLDFLQASHFGFFEFQHCQQPAT